MPSRQLKNGDVEGFGITFLEANLHGCPVIGGRSGGVIDAVAHKESGLLVEPGNIAELVQAMDHLLTNREYAKLLGAQGKKRAEAFFNWEHLIGNFQKELASLLKKPAM
jgi:phosphatidylinositol alpha-1,6-mannosyltransferase